MREAARDLTQRANAPKRRKGKKGGGGQGGPRTTRAIVADYLALCRNPSRDLRRWFAEDRNGAATGDLTRTTRRGGSDASPTKPGELDITFRIRRHTLPTVRGGLDEDRERWRRPDRLPARSRAGARGYEQLRPLRAETETVSGQRTARGDAVGIGQLFGWERCALQDYFKARLAITRWSVSGRDKSAALRAILDERVHEMRSLTKRQRIARMAAAEERAAERFERKLGSSLHITVTPS